MPKVVKKRSRGRYLKGNIDEELAMPGLAANTLVSTPFDEVVEEKTLISSIVATHSLSNFTIGDDKGPISVGVAHSDYTSAEIEEVIELASGWTRGNKVSQEIAKRLVRKIGTFSGPPGGGLGTAVLNEGKPIKTKLNWSITTGFTLKLWAYNHGTGAIATTTPDYHIQGHANLWN